MAGMVLGSEGSARGDAAPSPICRVLAVRLGGIGDIVLATPTLRLLAETLPEARIDVLVQEGFRDAVAGLPYVGQVWELNKRFDVGVAARFIGLGRRLRAERYDLYLNLQPSIKTHLLGRAAGAAHTLIFRKDRSIQPDTGRVRHAVDDFVKTLAPLGAPPATDRALDFFVPESAYEAIDRILCEHRTNPEQKLIVVNPTARRRVNRWPARRWAALIDTVASWPGYKVCVIGGKRDIRTTDEVRSESLRWSRDVLDLTCRISLKELGALLSRAQLLITSDTGPLHVAAAVGAPIVCLSGAADPDRTGPLTANSTVVIDRTLSCVSCGKKRCLHGRDAKCMSLIGIDDVIAALRHRLTVDGHLAVRAIATV